MCLGTPGKIINIFEEDSLRMGRVEYGGISSKVCLEYLPDARIGDYVIVHVGFGLSIIDESEAKYTLEYLGKVERGENEIS